MLNAAPAMLLPFAFPRDATAFVVVLDFDAANLVQQAARDE
ncbi:hypothetical protein [Nocardia gamkensis]